jgi:FkbM family methyltransferase
VLGPAPSDPDQERLWAGVSGAFGWDIGANSGESLVRMSRLFSRVLCAEPALESFAALRRTAACLGDCDITLLPGALAAHDGFLRMSAREQPILTGQLTPDVAGHEPPDGDWGSWGPPVEVREIPCLTADTIARQYGLPDFIKVDTEGHEVMVLAGARKLLADPRPPGWLIEFHSRELYDDCRQTLARAGYAQIATLRHPGYEPYSQLWHQHGWIRARFASD